MKKTAKVTSILLAVLIIMSAFSVMFTANAAQGDIIYFEKPADWNDPVYIYWWEGSGAPSWPGRKMTDMGGGVYSFTATTAITKFNINDGGAENVKNPHQTVDLNWPGKDKLGVVGKSAGANSYGNECWNLNWTEFKGLGLSVGADTDSCDFLGSLTVTLKASSATSAFYSINGGEKIAFEDGDKITIGADGEAGDIFTLSLEATDGTETKKAEYQYIKTDTPVADAIVYFDNSEFGWENVYCYAYGTKENGKWPGKAMSFDEKSGYYYITFDASFKSENIIFNDGEDGDINPDAQQYPKASGLPMNTGDSKLLTKELQWIDYGKPDSKPYGFAYTASGTKFSTETINVDIDLKNASRGTYSIDGGSEVEYTERTTITVGEGKIGNSDITLTLKAMNDKGISTTATLTFTKTFSRTETTFSSPSDGHTTEATGGNYATNPFMQLGANKTVTVDGDPSDWDSSMLIAQGVANDDPRVYMPSSIHERSVDDYALYAAWDDSNLYFMWEMANVSAILGGNDIFSAQKPNGSIWNPGLPVYMVLSVDPEKHAEGKARELDVKSNTWIESDSVWGSGISFDTNVDTFIAFDSANTNGGAAIIPLDDEGFFNYTESVNIGRPNNYAGTPNNNGFKIAWDYGTLSKEIIGINGFGGSREIGDTYDENSNWINFFDKGYKKDAGFIYEIAIPLEHLGIDKTYIEENGIGAMLISTYGTSAMNTLPHDPTVLDNADQEYSFDPSTSHEKEDADHITVPLARIGALLSDTAVNEAPLEVNFGTDKAAAQGVNTELTLKAEAYNGEAPYTYSFSVNGEKISADGNKALWTPTEKGVYTLSVTVTDAKGKTVSSDKKFTAGEEVEVVIPPTEPDTEPDTPTKPSTPDTEKHLLGDANLDGTVNVKDATLIQKHVAGISALTGVALTTADSDLDTKITVKDATAIQKFVAGLTVKTPVGENI